MPTKVSIKNVLNCVSAGLRMRVAKYHRWLKGNALALIESSMDTSSRLTPSQALSHVRHVGLKTPREAASIIRQARDAR